jgi:hypothetical protein
MIIAGRLRPGLGPEVRTGEGATVAPVPSAAKRASGNFSRRVASSQKSTPQGHDNAADD